MGIKAVLRKIYLNGERREGETVTGATEDRLLVILLKHLSLFTSFFIHGDQ